MIEVDISNVWGELSLPDLLETEAEVAAAHAALAEGTGVGAGFRGWLKLPVREPTEEMERIRKAAQTIRGDSEVCVVVGSSGCCTGSRAAVELLQGSERNIGRGKGDPQIFYAGSSFSTLQWNELSRLLEGRDFSVIVISGPETTTESAVAFRALRWMMQLKYGTDETNRRIYAVADPNRGALRQMAGEAGWETFDLPAGVCEEFSVLTAAGLLPMAVAGIDIAELMNGAVDAREAYDLRSFENPVWLYAAVRNALYRGGKKLEILGSWDPCFRMFGKWWQQLFCGAEGKRGKGIFPVPAGFTTELHTLGQMLQEGERNLFETMIRFRAPGKSYTIVPDWKDLDGLNYLEGMTLDSVDEQAYQAALMSHVDGGVGVITMDCGELNDRKVGELFYFLELCCGVSAYVLGVNPFEKPGVERCQQNLFRLLGKPDGEEQPAEDNPVFG